MTVRSLPILSLLLLLPGGVAAQDAAEILETAVERHEARIADIDDYTVVQETNGTEQVTYYEKRTVDGHPVFVPRSAADLAVARAGLSWGQLQGLLVNAFSGAGMEAMTGELRGASQDQLAVLVGSMGQRLGAGGGDVVSAAKDALVEAGTESVKDALVDAAIDAGLQALAGGIGGAAGAQVGMVIQALRDADGFGDALGNLAGALPGMLGAPGGGQGPGGMPGMNAMPGGLPGGPMGADITSDPRSMALSAAASAGIGALAGMGARAVAGALSSDDPSAADPFAMLRRLSDRFRVTGTGTVGGHPTWILEAEDSDGIEVSPEFAPRLITFHMDREAYVIRRVEMDGEMEMDGERRPVNVVVELEDYREVEGMLHPYRTTMAFGGMEAGMSDAEAAEMSEKMEEARRQMAEMEEQLARMPPEQRKMVEEQLERMGGIPGMQEQAQTQMDALAAGRMEMVVKEVRVNEGPPETPTLP